MPGTLFDMAVSEQVRPVQREQLRAGLWYGAAGLTILGAAAFDFFPFIAIARRLSNDGALSGPFTERIMMSQWWLGAVVVATAPIVAYGSLLVASLERLLRVSRAATFYAVLGAAIFLATLIVQTALFDNLPRVTDAISHLFQARIMNLGRVYVPAPACPESFFHDHILMSSDGKWFSKYTPGHALLLLIGLKCGLVWAVVPVCSAAAGLMLVWLVTRFYGMMIGRVTGILYLLSPLALLLGASFMSHTTAMALSLGAVCLVVRACDNNVGAARRWAMGIPAGLLFGWSLITRPPEFAILLVVLAMGVLLTPPRLWPRIAGLAPALLLGALPVALFHLWWNQQLYGTALAVGYGFTPGQVRHAPFQAQFGLSDTFPLSEAVDNFIWTLYRFDRVMLGWPSSLLLVPVALLAARWTRRELLCLAGCATVWLVYFFYSYYGHEYEARYYFMATPFLLVLTARGLQRATELFSCCGSAARPLAAALVAAFFLHGAVDYWRGYLWPTYRNDYEFTSPVPHRAAQRVGLSNALVLISQSGETPYSYSSGFLFNDPLLTNAVIYARDAPSENECLFAAFPGRTLYRFVPQPDRTSGRFEAVERAAPGN